MELASRRLIEESACTGHTRAKTARRASVITGPSTHIAPVQARELRVAPGECRWKLVFQTSLRILLAGAAYPGTTRHWGGCKPARRELDSSARQKT